MPKLSQILKTNSSIGWSSISTNVNAVGGNGFLILSNIILTLPASPTIGDVIQFTLLNNSEVTIERNGRLINSLPQNLLINKPSLIHSLIYSGAINGWFYSGGESTGIPSLAQDIAGSPGPKEYYGTNELGAKGFFSLPDIDTEKIPLSSIKDINAIVTSAMTL